MRDSCSRGRLGLTLALFPMLLACNSNSLGGGFPESKSWLDLGTPPETGITKGRKRCGTVEEDIGIRRQGSLGFPRSGLFTLEAHYVTNRDTHNPKSARDRIHAHLEQSCSLLQSLGAGFPRNCDEIYQGEQGTWTPAEGGGPVGMGARSEYRPDPLEEMFQGNLYYAPGQLPQPGTRYIITNRATGRSIVASFGYEIGPTSPKWLGGLTTEAHYYLDRFDYARAVLEIGRAENQALPFGPIDCSRD